MSALVDITGMRFGRLVVVERAGSDRRGNAMWFCRCDCGADHVTDGKDLRTGHTRSCGCAKRLDVPIGSRSGRLTVLVDTSNRRGDRVLICRCDCGTEYHAVRPDDWRRSHTRSCGCLQRERQRDRSTTHGLSGHALYGTWTVLVRRCCDPRSSSYPDYGGRGITISERWLGTPDGF